MNSGSFLIPSKKATALFALLAGVAGLLLLCWRFHQPYAAFGLLHGMVFYFSVVLIAAGITLFLLSLFSVSKQTHLKTGLVFLSVSLCLFLSEIYLRCAGIQKAYTEQRSGKYISPFVRHDTKFWNYEINSESYLRTPEYNYLRHHNNFGFSDVDFAAKKNSSEILIQTYGDSFTEGDGTPFDSSYPALLRTILKKNIVIQNFGVSGSDPGFYWKQLNDVGQALHPDIAVITYNASDLTTDFLTRGGLQRFKENYWQAADPPCWEWIYASSYLFRLAATSVFHISVNDFFYSEKTKAEQLKKLEPEWNETFLRIARLARQNNMKVLLIKTPWRGEVAANKYDYDFTFFEKMVDTVSVFKRYDLLPYYLDCAEFNPSNLQRYYWTHDGHPNSNGYAVMAKGVYLGLKKNYPDLF